MAMTIIIGWWIVPLALSIAAIFWCSHQDYSGDYNFNAVFTLPVTAFVISFVWMIYFGIGWLMS